MAISSISAVSFKGAENTVQNKKGGAGKAVVSWFIPGLGEFLDGRNKEGAIFLGTRLGVGTLMSILCSQESKNTYNALRNDIDNIKGSKILTAAIGILGLASLGLAIANTVDAYKGGSDNKLDTQA